MHRICCFCETWESGGIESFLNNVLLHMELSEVEVDVVAACMEESVFTAGLRARGVRFFELSGKLRGLQNYRKFRDLLRERRYDVVHFNLYQGLSLAYVHLAKREGVPVRIAHSHNTALRKSAARVLKLLLHRVGSNLYAKDATALWACSESAAKFLFPANELVRKGYRFIPNGIDTERFAFDGTQRETVRRELGLTDAFVVGNVGRLCYQKNQVFLLDVFAEVLKRKAESRLLLVGEGEDRILLEEKARTLGIEEKVIFYGVTDRVEQLLWAMDVFAFPSLFEGLGIVAVEAQAAGLPVVCSEYVPGEARVTGSMRWLPLDVSVWASTVAALSAAHRQDFARQVCDAGFDIRTVAEQIERYYLRQDKP